jgi:chromosome segregation ATPase
LEQNKGILEKEIKEKESNLTSIVTQSTTKDEQKNTFAKEVLDMEKGNRKLDKELNFLVRKNAEIRAVKDDSEASKERMKMELILLTRDFEKWKKSVEEDKKDIDQRMRERDLLNKDVVTAEEKERDKSSVIQTLENQFKKLENKILGYKAEA